MTNIYSDIVATFLAQLDRLKRLDARNNLGIIHSVKKVPGIDHLKSALKGIVEILFVAKLVQLSSILTRSLSVTCHLVCLRCAILSVHLKCVLRF